VVVPKFESHAKGLAPDVLWSAAHPNEPLDHVRYCPAEQPPSPLAKRSDVDAYDAVTFVVEAFAKVCVPKKVLLLYVFGIVLDDAAK
jgi:hypothetical protein